MFRSHPLSAACASHFSATALLSVHFIIVRLPACLAAWTLLLGASWALHCGFAGASIRSEVTRNSLP